MWNELYKDEYIKELENKLNRIKSLVDLFKGIDNDFIVEELIKELNRKTRENELFKEIKNRCK